MQHSNERNRPFTVLAWSLFPLGLLGVAGELADSSHLENLGLGLVMIAIEATATLNLYLLVDPTKLQRPGYQWVTIAANMTWALVAICATGWFVAQSPLTPNAWWAAGMFAIPLVTVTTFIALKKSSRWRQHGNGASRNVGRN